MADKSCNVTKRLLTFRAHVSTRSKNRWAKAFMRGMALETGQSLTSEQKRSALESVLHSQTFARSDQLRSFLKYVCETEMAGRGQALTEYLIGIEALGRPSSY